MSQNGSGPSFGWILFESNTEENIGTLGLENNTEWNQAASIFKWIDYYAFIIRLKNMDVYQWALPRLNISFLYFFTVL